MFCGEVVREVMYGAGVCRVLFVLLGVGEVGVELVVCV